MYFKIFRKNDNHHGFKYNDGLNTDVNEFDPNPEHLCVAGGLYFSDENNICEFLEYGDYIRQVEIPDGELIVKNKNKFRTHSLFLHPKKSLNDIDTWQWLIDNNVNIKAYNNNAIQWASANGHTAIVELLLKYDADCTAYNNEAVRWASVNGHTAIVEILLKYGADCTVMDNYALRWASANGYVAIVEILLKNGADCTVMDNDAIRWANRNGHTAVVELLLKHGATLL